MKHSFLKITALVAFIFLVAHSWAQDIIVTNKAQKIDAKILEVSSTEIRYKELDNLDGPIFVLRVYEINSIIYANGKVVLYNQQTEEQKSVEAITKENGLGPLFCDTTSVDQKGNSMGRWTTSGAWRLSGRSLRGTIPQPSNNFRQEGRVVVQIRVNAAGDVIEAKCINGTSVTDKQTQQLALDAAKKVKFTEGDHDQIGTITYIFKLN